MYQGDCWLGYDCCFCQRAATNSSKSWSTIDPTLWSLAFLGKASCTRCSHCFSTSHLSKSVSCTKAAVPPIVQLISPIQICKLNLGSSPTNRSITLPAHRPQVSSSQGQHPICFDWNENPAPGCPHSSCRFEHSCYYCTQNPAVREKGHKAIFCPHRVFSSQKLPLAATGIRHLGIQWLCNCSIFNSMFSPWCQKFTHMYKQIIHSPLCIYALITIMLSCWIYVILCTSMLI